MALWNWLKPHTIKMPGPQPVAARASSRPLLEPLEDRAMPSTTNVVINLAPNFFRGTVTETITATVTPSASETGPVSGTMGITVNNQTAQVVVGNSGQATATFTLPVMSLLAGQTVQATFIASSSASLPPGTTPVASSSFLSPVYMNLDNLFLPATITFGTPPANFTGFTDSTGLNPQFNSAFGETNTVSFFLAPVTYTYEDPGVITSVEVFGLTLTGPFLNLANRTFINPFSPFVYPVTTIVTSG
jgi:hypothetical protein